MVLTLSMFISIVVTTLLYYTINNKYHYSFHNYSICSSYISYSFHYKSHVHSSKTYLSDCLLYSSKYSVYTVSHIYYGFHTTFNQFCSLFHPISQFHLFLLNYLVFCCHNSSLYSCYHLLYLFMNSLILSILL